MKLQPRLGTRVGLVALVALLLAACAPEDAPDDEVVAPDETEEEVVDDDEEEPPDEEPEVDEEPTVVTVSTLAFPSLVAVLPPLIQEHGLGEPHGITLEIEPYSDIGGFYAATTQGAVDAAVGGPTVFQGLVGEGAEIQIVASYVGLEPLVVVTDDPGIETVEDLVGRSLAATVGSAEFQALAIYAASQGVDLTEDVTLINASLADVRSQLEAGRVDAGMFWEPAASLGLADNEDWRVFMNGDEFWTEMTGEKGWELVWAMQRSFIEENPDAVEPFIATLQDAVEFLFDSPEEAGRLMEDATGMPAEAFMTVLEEGRLDYDVRPAWDPDVTSNLEIMFEASVDHGFSDELPPDDMIYSPGG